MCKIRLRFAFTKIKEVIGRFLGLPITSSLTVKFGKLCARPAKTRLTVKVRVTIEIRVTVEVGIAIKIRVAVGIAIGIAESGLTIRVAESGLTESGVAIGIAVGVAESGVAVGMAKSGAAPSRTAIYRRGAQQKSRERNTPLVNFSWQLGSIGRFFRINYFRFVRAIKKFGIAISMLFTHNNLLQIGYGLLNYLKNSFFNIIFFLELIGVKTKPLIFI